jgi:hypothetical protein
MTHETHDDDPGIEMCESVSNESASNLCCDVLALI